MTSKDEFHKMVVKSLPGPLYAGTLESYEKWVGKKKKLLEFMYLVTPWDSHVFEIIRELIHVFKN